ncbi:hypothetical protein CF326_g8595, partial [Tilletia indica]
SHPEVTLTTSVSVPLQVVAPTSVSVPTQVAAPTSVSRTNSRSSNLLSVFVPTWAPSSLQSALSSYLRLCAAYLGSSNLHSVQATSIRFQHPPSGFP